MIDAERIQELRELKEDWDSYGAGAPTEEALSVLKYLCVVPTPDSGVQIELHAGKKSIEIIVSPEGVVTGISFDDYERAGLE